MQRHSIGIFAIAYGLLANASVAQAAIETWVSGTGSDAGNCPITAPCRTFAFAHSKTNNGGMLNVLSSGNFGPLTITKSISIVAQGVEAVINTGTGGAGIIIQGGAGAVVSLRGLTIDLRGTDNHGISFVSGAALHVQNCVVRRTNNYGISFAPASGTSDLYIADSVIANTESQGIEVGPTGSGSASVVLDRVRVENASDDGIRFFGRGTTGSIAATMRDSVAAGNSGTGIRVSEGGSGTTTVMIDRTAAVNNEFGIIASGTGATVLLGDSTVTGNVTGLNFSNGGVIASYGTNKVNGNGTDGAPTGTVIAHK
jgi:hypothetical protein